MEQDMKERARERERERERSSHACIEYFLIVLMGDF